MTESAVKKVRKGTRSCVECRVRKVRCIYLNTNDDSCQQCSLHHRTCQPQVYARKHDSPHNTSKQRLSATARLQELEARISRIANSVSNAGRLDLSDDDSGDESLPDVVRTNATQQYEDEAISSPPTHLKLIFEDDMSTLQEERLPSAHSARSERRTTRARLRLQPLIPSREDCSILAEMSGPWLQMYHTFFPALSVGPGAIAMSSYDDMTSETANPIAVAAYLTSLAMTLVQFVQNSSAASLHSIDDPAKFIRRVVDTTRRAIIMDNHIAASVSGIEFILLYVRLQLNRGDVRDMWMSLRRAIALSEYLGLQRTMYRRIDYQDNGQPTDHDTALFASVCAVDRMVAMMFNLPAGTANYALPEKHIVDHAGQISLYGYMLHLTSIAMLVQEIDEELARSSAYDDVYQKVVSADSKLRGLESKTPPDWWHDPTGQLQPRFLPQLIQCYLTVRIHLHSVMRPSAKYAYSWHRCIEAAQQTARRYLLTRPLLPPGFFLTRLFQIQIFTVAIVLLLSKERRLDAHESFATPQQNDALITNVIHSLEHDASSTPAEFARLAAEALKSLQQWLDTPELVASGTLAFRVPMLGKMVMRRSSHKQAAAVPSANGYAYDPAILGNGDVTAIADGFERDSLAWLVEFDVDSLGDDILFNSTFDNTL